ncbi:aspartyl/glutamyl-tRNA(Asn/Gln) amidotransferase subunit B [Desulfonispora thiosulfatigenes DSM 11270]|uniref:Aspartyl/glutamyl-tRNA(Asn/Gln) amidotransferase subunit B n=1 Tax=Desulfonispora thiosulfatigenes DSM 11270 TaxID=656914 RepID=A0A1W1UGH1_DESTI|nr:Asp-tRNA(Asn)/Glu-tRNA(Gln) amidotransferase subunit GatB [Desulfonispora thiosulfatigenes]SMB80122.1 aspartyl/glutamyl-tRNA(Asn/Gln) amidotransferase subunit B [Desulfonispora thiosulfatigenes DSM 11270]
MANYEAVIGLEVHVELKTNTKIFCSCPNEFGLEPNTNVCPVCLALPGTLPVLNKQVLEYAVKAGIAVNCDISEYSEFDRKNYFYPDLPKAYQTSQFHFPICKNGHLDIEVNGETKRVGITQIHMEEDAGKLVHQGSSITDSDTSLADYNRGGVPLIEIVSEPDMRSAEEARAYLEKLKAYIEYTGVSDVKMEQGSLRCDANVSVRPVGQKEFGTRAEVKNLNSFRSVQRAIEYEIERQIAEIEDGGRIIQETRTWDENKGVTRSLRSKEGFSDYRYFPDPDLAPIVIDQEYITSLRNSLPELPDDKKNRLVTEQGLPEYDASVITSSRALAEFYDQTVAIFNDPKAVSNWIMGEFMKLLNAEAIEISDSKITPQGLAKLLELIEKGTISGKIAKTVFDEMFASGKDAEEIVKEQGLVQISDEGELASVIETIIANNPKSVEDFKAGKGKAIGFLVGQVMKETKGQANPGVVNKILNEKLSQM